MSATYIENYQRVIGDTGKPSGNEWVFYCPFEGCSGYKKRKFFVNPERGFWCCKHCGKEVPNKVYRTDCKEASGGTASEFADLMNDDASLWPTGTLYDTGLKTRSLTGKQRRQVWSAMFGQATLSEEHKQFMLDRGINPEKAGLVTSTEELFKKMQEIYDDDQTLIRAGIAYRTPRGELLPRMCVHPGRILIPYYDGEEVYYFVGYAKCPKRRPDQDLEEYQSIRNDWKKIAGPAGYTPAIYGDVPKDAPYLIVTEGQFKAEAARQTGFPCVGLQGIMNAHASLVKKCSTLGTKRVIILFDTQLEDQDDVDWAAEKLARELIKAGIETYRVSLPLEPQVDRGYKMDIDSYLLTFGVENFIQKLMSPQRYSFSTVEDTDTDDEEGEEEPE